MRKLYAGKRLCRGLDCATLPVGTHIHFDRRAGADSPKASEHQLVADGVCGCAQPRWHTQPVGSPVQVRVHMAQPHQRQTTARTSCGSLNRWCNRCDGCASIQPAPISPSSSDRQVHEADQESCCNTQQQICFALHQRRFWRVSRFSTYWANAAWVRMVCGPG